MSDHEYTSENTVHYEPEANTIEESKDDHDVNDDAKSSTSSTLSRKAREVKKCPFCDRESQLRVMFNHVRTAHPYEFLMCMDVFEDNKMDEVATTGSAFPFTFNLTNDFDEEEEVKIYGCLACNCTMTNKARANAHCFKDKCKKKHIAGIKDLIKQNKEDKKKAKAKVKAKKAKVRSVSEITASLILWQRRYLHLVDICTQVNQEYEHLKIQESINIQAGKDIQITMYDSIDFKIPSTAKTDKDQLERAENMWAKRAFELETKFDKLRDYLGEYSIFGMNKYYCITSDHPHRLFVGLNGHDYLGDDKYPPLP